MSSAITGGGGGGGVSPSGGSTISGATATTDLLTLKTTDDNVTKDALRVLSSADAEVFTVSPTGAIVFGTDTMLIRSAAGTIRHINTTNPQKEEFYNTSDSNTSPTNYERVDLGVNPAGIGANTFGLVTAVGGSGSGSRALYLGTGSGTSGNTNIVGGGSIVWFFSGSSGALIPGSDNGYDIGFSGARARAIYSVSQQGANVKTLTESSATAFVQIGVPSGEVVAGNIEYSIEANDGTDYQCRSGILPFCAVNKAGTETGAIGTVGAATEVAAVSSGTLTNTFTLTTAAANAITLNANAVSSLTQTTLRITYKVNIYGGSTTGTATVTPQ